MSDSECRTLLLKAKQLLSRAIEEKKHENSMVDPTGVCKRQLSLLRGHRQLPHERAGRPVLSLGQVAKMEAFSPT
jgi:hypothetical protein